MFASTFFHNQRSIFMEKQEALSILESNKDAWFNDDSSCKVLKGSDIHLVESGIAISGMPATKKAIDKLLSRMGLNNKFMDYKNLSDVGVKRFNETMDNIVDWNKDRKLLAYIDNKKIVDIVPCNPSQDFQKNEHLNVIYNEIRENIELLTDDKIVDNFKIDTESKEIKVSLVSPDSKFAMLKEDEWVLGSLIGASLSGVSYSPYYGRLVCMNGMIDGIKLRNSVINGKNHTTDVMRTYIGRGFRMSEASNDHIQKIGRSSIETPASLAEYMMFRNLMSSLMDDRDVEERQPFLDKVFSIREAINAYGCDVTSKSRTWQQSALSGLSVYELLNDITKFTTHDSTLSEENRVIMNKEASKWFLRSAWHNLDVAPRVNFSKSPTYNDSVLV